MMMQTPTAAASLDSFFETVHAFHRTAALKAAIELDLFTAIGEGATAPAAIARRCNAAERGVRILSDYLTVCGFLTKNGGAYALSPDAAFFLDRRSPACVGGAIEFLLSPTQVDAFKDLTTVVRRGETVLSKQGVLAPDHPVWIRFARAMAPIMSLPSDALASLLGAEAGEPWRVLDLAAGHGLFGIAMARKNRNARVVAVDWAPVLEVAVENARAAGVADRYKTVSGDALTIDWGNGYDVVLLTNFLHHFDLPHCERLMARVQAALKLGGRAAILEFIPNEDRISPAVAAQFSLIMLATTPAGDAYTFFQYERLLRKIGFARSKLHELPPTYFRVVIAEK